MHKVNCEMAPTETVYFFSIKGYNLLFFRLMFSENCNTVHNMLKRHLYTYIFLNIMGVHKKNCTKQAMVFSF